MINDPRYAFRPDPALAARADDVYAHVYGDQPEGRAQSVSYARDQKPPPMPAQQTFAQLSQQLTQMVEPLVNGLNQVFRAIAKTIDELDLCRLFGIKPWVIGIGDPPPRDHVSRHLRTQRLRLERRASRKAGRAR